MKRFDDRRGFLTTLGKWTGLTSLVLAGAGSLRFLFPRTFYEPSTRFKIGSARDFPKGKIRFLAERKCFVGHDDDGIYVVSAVCTHLGCVVKQSEQGFRCPCHGSDFGKSGEVRSGPAPSGLAWLEVSTAPSGHLVVDASRIVKKGTKLRTA